MKVSVITFGCKVNQYESQSMLSQLIQGGFQVAGAEDSPDVILFNSCTVTSASDQKVRQILRKARREHPDAILVLTGCMPQAFPEDAEALQEADVILGNRNRSVLLPRILEYLSTHQRIVDVAPHETGDTFEPMAVGQFYDRTRAFLKIQDGCNRFCSYCIIPHARGRVRSKPLDDLRREAARLGENGYREIVLTGINLSSYGQDLGLHLCDAIEAACEAPGIQRVRLGSLEPEQLQADVIARLARQPKLCDQFHLSLQSGCDTTLHRMNRHYTTAEYREIVANLRAVFPNAAITTDIMVGFPGETPEEFAQSLAFAKEIRFAKAHVFSYSRRPGTKAAEAPDQIPNKEKEQRSRAMIAAAAATQAEFLQSQVGREEDVLLEQEVSPRLWEGYTRNYTPVKVQGDGLGAGALVRVRLTHADASSCLGVTVHS